MKALDPKVANNPFAVLNRRIEEFARVLGLEGEITAGSVGDAMIVTAYSARDWPVLARSPALVDLHKIVRAYDAYRTFSAQSLLKELAKYSESYMQRSSEAAELEQDDAKFEARKAARKRTKEAV